MTNNWREWGLARWNDRFLDHFFSAAGREKSAPVSNLLVTAEELLRAVGESDHGLGKEVRNAFVKTVLEETPADRELFDYATDGRAELSFSPTVASVRPPTFVYLVFSCLAAAESSDELGRESSYRERLQILSNSRCSGWTLKFLPDLWERLSSWLALPENRRLYRPLILPPPNAHTLIGYSERLAFPHRKDQRELARVLHAHDLCGVIPPPGAALSAVAQNIAAFSPAFRSAFMEFQAEFNLSPNDPHLAAKQFWSAVVDAALRGRDGEADDFARNQIDFVAAFDGEQLQLYLFSTEPCRAPAGTSAEHLKYQVSDWRFAYPELETGSFHRSAEQVLRGQVRLSRVADGVKAGMIPLVYCWSDYMSVADAPEELASANIALIRSDKIDEALKIFGGRRTDCSACEGNWVLVERLDFKRQGGATSGFAGLRSLQKRMPVDRLYFFDGYRSDDGYLGIGEILPLVRAPRATRVAVSQDGAVRDLGRVEGDVWTFPRGDIDGDVVVSAWESDELIATQAVRFVARGNRENYRYPPNPESFLLEGATGALAWPEALNCSKADAYEDVGFRTGNVILLGRSVGEFVNDLDKAAWIATRRGANVYEISLPDSQLAGLPPERKIDHKGQCRIWCQMLEKGETDFAHLQLSEKRSVVRHMINTRVCLPTQSAEGSVPQPRPYERFVPKRPAELDSFVSVIAARSSGRAGLPISEWRELVGKLLGLGRKNPYNPHDSVDVLTRCWNEAGLLDIATSVRWRSKAIFAVKPKLVLYKNGKSISGALVGLTLSTSMAVIAETARKAGAAVDLKTSPCRFVPETYTFSSQDPEVFERVAKQNLLEIRWLRTGAALPLKRCVEHERPYPQNYEIRWRSDAWSISGDRVPSALLLTHARDDMPTFWSVADSPGRWTFDRNIARLHACAHAKIEPFVSKGGFEIEGRHGYLPLPLARYAAITGPILPGPETTENSGSGHIYAFGSTGFRDEVLALSKIP